MMIEAEIEEAARRLTQASPRARIFLFGSHARVDANTHSDLDFLVVEPEVENAAEESVRRGSIVHAALAEGRELAAHS